MFYTNFLFTDLNLDAATFTGNPSSYLTVNLARQKNPLDQTIVLSFRTFKPEALLFYAHDHLGNFVQMELQQGIRIVFTYNMQYQVVSGSVTANGRQ